MKRIAVLGLIVAAFVAPAAAQASYTPQRVVTNALAARPYLCHVLRVAVQVEGYDRAEAEFIQGYDLHATAGFPPGAPVFATLVRRCHV